jgi:hypothetical protein
MRWPAGHWLRACLALGLALCAIVVGLSTGSSVRAAPTLPHSDYFGMNAQYVFKLPPDQWDRQLAAIANTGVGVVREDAFWSQAEPRPPIRGRHSYNWSAADSIAAALARNGLRWYPILDYSTPWAGTLSGAKRWKSAPANPTDFAAYAAAFAERYGTGGSFWSANPSLPVLPVQSYEIWNEPNLADFWPDIRGAAARYGELLAVTAPAIRAADPAGSVVLGGLSPTGLVEFLDEIEAGNPGLIAQMDAVAFHPYGTTFANTGARVRVLREWLDEHGAAALPIEVTETGWATPPLPEADRATRMAILVRGLSQSSCDISRIIPYTWMTFEGDSSNPEEWFGIANEDGSLKPTGVALTAAMGSVMAGEATTVSDPCAGLGEGEVSGPRFPEVGSELPEAPPASPETEPGPSEAGPDLSDPEPAPEPSNPEPPAPAPSDPASTPRTPPASAAVGSLPALAPESAPAATGLPETEVGIKVKKRPNAIAVQVTCSRACRPIVRLRHRGGRSIAVHASNQLVRHYRTLLALPTATHGTITVRATVETPGREPQLLVRRLR